MSENLDFPGGQNSFEGVALSFRAAHIEACETASRRLSEEAGFLFTEEELRFLSDGIDSYLDGFIDGTRMHEEEHQGFFNAFGAGNGWLSADTSRAAWWTYRGLTDYFDITGINLLLDESAASTSLDKQDLTPAMKSLAVLKELYGPDYNMHAFLENISVSNLKDRDKQMFSMAAQKLLDERPQV